MKTGRGARTGEGGKSPLPAGNRFKQKIDRLMEARERIL